jgi:hypothetical protein
MPFAVVLSYLRYSGRVPPRSFIPLLLSWRARCLFPSVRILRAPRSPLSLVRFFLTKFPLRRATPARRVVSRRTAANIFQDPQFPGSVPSASGGALRLDAGPYAALTISTVARSLGTSRCSASDSMWSEVGSLHSRFLDHLQIVTASNYNTIADLHTTKYFTLSFLSVFTRRFLVTNLSWLTLSSTLNSLTDEWLPNLFRVLLLFLGANRIQNTTFKYSCYSVFISCCVNVC